MRTKGIRGRRRSAGLGPVRFAAGLLLVLLVAPSVAAPVLASSAPESPDYQVAAPYVWVYLWGQTADPWTYHDLYNWSFAYDSQVQLWAWDWSVKPQVLNVTVVEFQDLTASLLVGVHVGNRTVAENVSYTWEDDLAWINATVVAPQGWSSSEISLPEVNGTFPWDAADVRVTIGAWRVATEVISHGSGPFGNTTVTTQVENYNASWDLRVLTPQTAVVLTDLTAGQENTIILVAVVEGIVLTFAFFALGWVFRRAGGRIPLTWGSVAWTLAFLLPPPVLYIAFWVEVNQLLGQVLPWLIAPWILGAFFPYMGLVFNLGHSRTSVFVGFRALGDRQGNFVGATYHTGYWMGMIRALPETWREWRYVALHGGKMPALPTFKKRRKVNGAVREIRSLLEIYPAVDDDPRLRHRLPFHDYYCTRPEADKTEPSIVRTYARKERGRHPTGKSYKEAQPDGTTKEVPITRRNLWRSWVAPTLTFVPGHQYYAGRFASGLEKAHMEGEDVALYHAEALQLRAELRRTRDYRVDEKGDHLMESLAGAEEELTDEEAEEVREHAWDKVTKELKREKESPGGSRG